MKLGAQFFNNFPDVDLSWLGITRMTSAGFSKSWMKFVSWFQAKIIGPFHKGRIKGKKNGGFARPL